MHDTYVKKSVNTLPKVVGFFRVLRFRPTGNVDRVGWGLALKVDFQVISSCPEYTNVKKRQEI
jgi:hypothetical protein